LDILNNSNIKIKKIKNLKKENASHANTFPKNRAIVTLPKE